MPSPNRFRKEWGTLPIEQGGTGVETLAELVSLVGGGGGGGGEANTASNVGSGALLFKNKDGVDLRFRSLLSSDSALILTQNTDDISLSIDRDNLTMPYVTEIAYDTNGNVEYVGEANPGTAEAAPTWRLKKLSYNGSGDLLDVRFADGNANFDNIWTNRNTYTYS